METVEYKNISFTVWDVGGQDKVWMLCTMPDTAACQVVPGTFKSRVHLAC